MTEATALWRFRSLIIIIIEKNNFEHPEVGWQYSYRDNSIKNDLH